jgi:hypothetical protein
MLPAMNAKPQGIPLRPDPGAVATRNVKGFARAVIAKAIGRLDHRNSETAVLRSRWPDDSIAPLVLRAASEPPAELAGNTALGTSIVADLISAIGPVGAGARLLQAGLQLLFGREAIIWVPGMEVTTAAAGSFVQEGAPIPVHDLVSTSVPLVPRKLPSIVTLTQELLDGSNAEVLVTDALTRSVGLALDACLFDSAPADEIRPAGLRHGIAALPASTSADARTCMIEDMTALAEAVAIVGGPIVYVAAPARSMKMMLWSYREIYPIFGSPALAPNDLMAIAVKGLASAVDAVPEIEASKVATLHMEDTAPLPIIGGTPGSPVPAAPTRSLWQTNAVGIKIRFHVDWVLRDTRALAWTTISGW